MLSHPEAAYRSCEECRKWYYDPKTGELQKQWQIIDGERQLVPTPRKPGDVPGCWQCPKCEGLPDKERNPASGVKAELSAKNWKALRFYFEQKATGGPVDAVARRNCGIIEWIVSQHAATRDRATIELLKVLCKVQ